MKLPRNRLLSAAILVLLAVAAGTSFTACSPAYVIKAGIAQAKILAARRPLPEVVIDPATDERTRGLLTLAMEARTFAQDELRLEVGKSYTTFTQLDSDTLALVLSAAYPDRLVPRTWWFPIVGRVPYRGYFSEDDALEEQAKLDDEGYDTLLRPTAAFSTLGWFADPILSSLLRSDDIELIETLIHEMSHAHLFVSGQVRFNESFATFVGRVGAIQFFCTRDGGGPDTVKCLRAQARWRDAQRYSLFLDQLIAELQAVYADPDTDRAEKLRRREAVYDAHRQRFEADVAPSFESLRFGRFMQEPLNNAVLLGQMRYYHRIADFAAFLESHDHSLTDAVAALVAGVEGVDDPFDLLPAGTDSVVTVEVQR
jgi:predicted aminopeptidase